LENLLNPVILFFLAGILAALLRSDLRIPDPIYEAMSIFLLIAIGLKGGIALRDADAAEVAWPIISTLGLGLAIPVVAYVVLRRLGRFNRADAAALSAHYGSVSAVTFAVTLSFLDRKEIAYEGYATVLLSLMEIPAIAVAIGIFRFGERQDGKMNWPKLLHEVFLGKSIFLLLTGLFVGLIAGGERTGAIGRLFIDQFQGILAVFLLTMGMLAARRFEDLKKVGPFLLAFGILMPLAAGLAGAGVGAAAGLSLGETTVLAVLTASASYIAAPAAVRVAIPQANPTLYLTAAIGITFPFNVIIGIPIYHAMAGLFV